MTELQPKSFRTPRLDRTSDMGKGYWYYWKYIVCRNDYERRNPDCARCFIKQRCKKVKLKDYIPPDPNDDYDDD